jgi:hypothetical protein
MRKAQLAYLILVMTLFYRQPLQRFRLPGRRRRARSDHFSRLWTGLHLSDGPGTINGTTAYSSHASAPVLALSPAASLAHSSSASAFLSNAITA